MAKNIVLHLRGMMFSKFQNLGGSRWGGNLLDEAVVCMRVYVGKFINLSRVSGEFRKMSRKIIKC